MNYLDTGKSVMISAPAGSGKTQKLAGRYIALMKSGVDVERILAVTFTEKAAAELRAKADAAPTIENGEATVRVLEVTAQAWDRMGPKAKELYVIQNLEDIVSTVIEKTHDIEVREVTMLDRGDGSSLASYAAAFPQTVAAILQSLSATTGIDVHQILSGDASGTTPSRASLPSTSGLQGGR